ncbi:hypothetical protein GGE45_000602 [Rhizobium aethiopicum]|uniref:Esterase-like activity of phytase n=1 Tax=Rhizobium aethiopicum TaxID=1138170 RepID=A0A7W6Q858_9HYPH|nr:hypothetical protein [Rhizobium aethiopicum]MBB4578300.1 hypothetical protein [Rhizobium aethiopicum]
MTSAEIITATDDGNTLIYSDSPLGAIGFIDITSAKAPKAAGALMMDGEPTSVTSSAGKALVAVNTSESKAKPSGRLAIVDVATTKIENTCDLGGQPDSTALNKEKTFGAIATENERDENVNDGKIPQMPAKLGGELPVAKKTEAHDFLGELKTATNGYVLDKLEGFAFDASGKPYAVTDNDGMSDSSGETLFFPVNLTATNGVRVPIILKGRVLLPAFFFGRFAPERPMAYVMNLGKTAANASTARRVLSGRCDVCSHSA